MASQKIYGRDGPPQLRRRVEDIPPEEVSKFYGDEGLLNWQLSVPEWWGKRVRCLCGVVHAFEVLVENLDLTSSGPGRCDLRCAGCGDRFLFFDDLVHGWNAVIVDQSAPLPEDYLQASAQLLQPLVCQCGGRLFSVIAEVQYDCGDGIEELAEDKWDDAYGSFVGTARCVACGALHTIAEAETA
jgi:hypothetical protein